MSYSDDLWEDYQDMLATASGEIDLARGDIAKLSTEATPQEYKDVKKWFKMHIRNANRCIKSAEAIRKRLERHDRGLAAYRGEDYTTPKPYLEEKN